MQAEIVIIGAGIIGSLSALFLTSYGKEVVIVDSSNACQEASGVNAGTLSLLVAPFQLLPFAHAGVNLWNSLHKENGVDVGYKRVGGLKVALQSNENEELLKRQSMYRRYGLNVVDFPIEEASYLSSSVLGAIYSDLDGFANPLIAGDNIMKKACHQGATFFSKKKVMSVYPGTSKKYIVETEDGQLFSTNKVLIATGIRSPKLLKQFGVHLHLIEKINQIVVVEKAPPILPHIINHQHLSLKQNSEGSLLIGGGWQGYGDLESNEKKVSATSILGNVGLATRIVPLLRKQYAVRSWAGFEGYTADKMPVVKEIPGYKGVFVAVSGYIGFTIGPLLALMATEMMLD